MRRRSNASGCGAGVTPLPISTLGLAEPTHPQRPTPYRHHQKFTKFWMLENSSTAFANIDDPSCSTAAYMYIDNTR